MPIIRPLPQPQVQSRAERPGSPWFFRYDAREVLSDGSVRKVRRYREIGPSKGRGLLTRKQAETARDEFLSLLLSPPAPRPSQPAPSDDDIAPEPTPAGSVLFGRLARLYLTGYLSRRDYVSEPTRQKEELYIREYLIPRWGTDAAHQIPSKAIEDWLHTAFGSWWTMHGVRGIMNRIYRHAEGHGLWPEGRPSPASKARLGRKRHKRVRRILSFVETARVLAQLNQPYRLIIQTCIATGARISEVLGLQWKHVDLEAATIRIEQRVWHQEIALPKSESSRRVLGLGDIVEQFTGKALLEKPARDTFVFTQKRDPEKPLWDSGVRDALHQAAQAECCDFAGLGPHSFRRANITWRQEVGGSAIEASRIAGHSGLNMTSEYTFVTPERQNELTRRIQEKLAFASPSRPALALPETTIHGSTEGAVEPGEGSEL
jgi:integrase